MTFMNNRNTTDLITLKDIVEILRNYWMVFIIIPLFIVTLAYLYLYTLPPIYQRKAVVLIKNEQKPSNDLNTAILELKGISTGSSIDDDSYILSSYQIISEVVRRLNLDINYTTNFRWKRYDLYQESPINIVFNNEFSDPINLSIQPGNDSLYVITQFIKNGIPQITKHINCKYGKPVQLSGEEFRVERTKESIKDEIIHIQRNSLEVASYNILMAVKTSVMDKGSSLINIICNNTNITKADAILNTIIEVYNENLIDDKNKVAQNTSKFIEKRIKIIGEELLNVELEYTNYKRSNQITDVPENIKVYLQTNSKLNEEYLHVSGIKTVLEDLKAALENNADTNTLLPSIEDLGDQTLRLLIQEYNENMLKRIRLANNSGVTNMIVVELDKKLNSLRTTIIYSVSSTINSLRLKEKSLLSSIKNAEFNIRNIPEQERFLIDILRQQEIKASLYNYLLNKREETHLQLAVTDANIRIIEKPFGIKNPIAPRRNIFLLAALIAGFFIPLIFFILKNYIVKIIHHRKDIEEYSNIPIIGEIPLVKKYDASRIVVTENTDNRIVEAFRMLRMNLKFLDNEAKVLMLTSTLPGEGKSFIARNLGISLRIAGYKVILIDTDLRKQMQSRLSEKTKSIGLTDYLSDNSINYSEIIERNKQLDIDMIYTGPKPPNPGELLMRSRMKELIEKLKEEYDYILIDNVPISISDAFIINHISDLTLYILRSGCVNRKVLDDLYKYDKEKKLKKISILFNGSLKRKDKYGYYTDYYSDNNESFYSKISKYYKS